MASKNWNEAKAAAMKILGDKGKIPEPKVNFAKVREIYDKADKEYYAAVDNLQSKILALQNMTSTFKNTLKQYSEIIAKSNLGLDTKDADDKKTIDQAAKILDDYLDEQMDNCDADIKNLDELDKHSMAISKYEGKTGS